MMTTLFIVIALGILFGSVCLWASGYYIGLDSAPTPVAGNNAGAVADNQNSSLKMKIDSQKQQIEQLQKDVTAAKATAGPAAPKMDDQLEAIAEMDRMTVELENTKTEKDDATSEIEVLKKEIATLKEKSKSELPNLPKPPAGPPGGANDAVDSLQAKLDMEKVAHQKTKDELTQAKKLAAVKLGGGPTMNMGGGAAPSAPAGGSGSGAGRFKTMAFAPRGGGAGGGGGGAKDIMAQALQKVQSEKSKVESELERAKKEIQLLKMRK